MGAESRVGEGELAGNQVREGLENEI